MQSRTIRFVRSLFIHIPRSTDDMHEFFEEHPHLKTHDDKCLVCIKPYVYVWREKETYGKSRQD